MTNALRELVRAQSRDRDFPYMDFVGAFMLMERWIRHTGGHTWKMVEEAQPVDLLGLPLGTTTDDIKLGYVLSLLRNHGKEVMDGVTQEEAAERAPLYH